MEIPSPTRMLIGMALLGFAVSGYWPEQWPTASVPGFSKPSPAPLTYSRYQDKQVALELPSGWRWLPQKPDPAEADASYFALSRFQGQNAVQEPVSVRVDGIPNSRNLSAAAFLAVLAKGVPSNPDSAKPLSDLPPATAGMTFASTVMGRPVRNYVFVNPGDTLCYVLSINSTDERFTQNMAMRAFQSLQITL